MNSQDFIIGKLRELSSKYAEVKIRYEYRTNTLSHIVEIIPLSFFEGNLEYLADEAELEDQFEQAFPLENIVFVSEDSLTEIRKADLELGYDGIFFVYPESLPEFEVYGYSEAIETSLLQDNYALAA